MNTLFGDGGVLYCFNSDNKQKSADDNLEKSADSKQHDKCKSEIDLGLKLWKLDGYG